MEWVKLVAEPKSPGSGSGGVVFAKGLGTFAVKRTKKQLKAPTSHLCRTLYPHIKQLRTRKEEAEMR